MITTILIVLAIRYPTETLPELEWVNIIAIGIFIINLIYNIEREYPRLLSGGMKA